MDFIGTFSRLLHVVLLALWLGGGVFFAAVFAPDAFAVVPSRQVAGDVVGTVLAHFDLFGLIAGPLIFISLFTGYLPLGVKLRFRAVAAVVMTAMTAVSGRWLTPKMIELRQAMGRPIDDVAAGDPLKMQFENLHTASEAIMVVHLVLALGLLAAAIIATAPRRSFGSIEL